jgi:RHS repeat-associated protein
LLANEQYSYTADGRLLKKKLVVNGVALEATLGYDSKARLNSITYPGSGGTYTYEYDSQSRLSKLKQGSTELVSTVQYGVAGELLQLDGETREYNALGQLTRITSRAEACVPGFYCPPPDTDFEYRYSATANNGQITQMKNWKSGEEVTYAYDSLSRLASATTTGPEWGMAWSWDGWGNRMVQSVTKGSAPTITLSYNAATNRINSSGYTYDGAGNLTQMPKGAGSLPMQYDVENRLIFAGTESRFLPPGDIGERYSYAPDNKRVYRKVIATGEERVEFWLGGQLLAEFTPNSGWTSVSLAFAYKYFGSRRVGAKNDRLGSVVSATKSYYPFGEEKVVTADGSYKFATYRRDSWTGLDYAQNRYYSAGIGRFTTPDPYQASGGVGNPGSWNRYGYVEGDPVNYGDPGGLNRMSPNSAYRRCLESHVLTVRGCVELAELAEDDMWGGGGGGGDLSGPGGGGGAGRGESSVTDKGSATQALLDLLPKKLGSHCWRLFGMGSSLASTTSKAKQITFFDGRSDQGWSDQFGGGPHETFAQYHSEHLSVAASTLTDGRNRPTAHVVLWADFFGNVQGGHPTGRAEQQALLWHEFVHVWTGLGDEQLAGKYARNGLTMTGYLNASQAFDAWLGRDCGPKTK